MYIKCIIQTMGKTLIELRDKAYLSQSELAKEAGVTATTISRIETGKREPLRRTIRKLAKALEVKPGDIEFPL